LLDKPIVESPCFSNSVFWYSIMLVSSSFLPNDCPVFSNAGLRRVGISFVRTRDFRPVTPHSRGWPNFLAYIIFLAWDQAFFMPHPSNCWPLLGVNHSKDFYCFFGGVPNHCWVVEKCFPLGLFSPPWPSLPALEECSHRQLHWQSHVSVGSCLWQYKEKYHWWIPLFGQISVCHRHGIGLQHINCCFSFWRLLEGQTWDLAKFS
jgi:hypothetical protein